jgi:hypothetical protein
MSFVHTSEICTTVMLAFRIQEIIKYKNFMLLSDVMFIEFLHKNSLVGLKVISG